MKRFLILPLLLASCAPLQSAVNTVKAAAIIIQRDGPDLVIFNAGPGDLTGDPSRPGDGVSLVVDSAPGYTPDAAGLAVCPPDRKVITRFNCNIPTIPEGKSFRLSAAVGTVLDAAGSGYRAKSGVVPVPIVLLK